MWLLVLAVLSVLLFAVINRRPARVEGFETLPAAPVARYARSDALSCLAAAVDRNVPIKTGVFQVVPTPASYVTAAMARAVDLINARCSTDFVKVAVDVPKREDDGSGNVQCTGRVHVYSPFLNAARTITIKTLHNPTVARLYLTSAVPLSSCAEDTSGLEAAPCSEVGLPHSDYCLL